MVFNWTFDPSQLVSFFNVLIYQLQFSIHIIDQDSKRSFHFSTFFYPEDDCRSSSKYRYCTLSLILLVQVNTKSSCACVPLSKFMIKRIQLVIFNSGAVLHMLINIFLLSAYLCILVYIFIYMSGCYALEEVLILYHSHIYFCDISGRLHLVKFEWINRYENNCCG